MMTKSRLTLFAATWRLALVALMCCGPRVSLAQDALVRSFAPGDALDSVGVIDASEDTEIDGPQALFAGDGGDLFLLDQNNGRVLQFDPRNDAGRPQALELPPDLRPTDLIVSGDRIIVWDGQPRALQAIGPADAPTRGLSLTRAIESDDEVTTSMFAQMGTEAPDAVANTPEGLTRSLGAARPTRPRQIVRTRGRGDVTAQFQPQLDDSRIVMQLRSRALALPDVTIRVGGQAGAVELLEIDRRGRVFVLVEDVAGSAAATVVARYDPVGALEGIYELPLSGGVALSRRFVTVSPDGEVYMLRTRTGQVEVLSLAMRKTTTGAITPKIIAPPQPARRTGQARAAVRPLNRERVVETAYAFANARWTLNPSAYGADPDTVCAGFNRVRRPWYLHGHVNQLVTGVPYCWGCHGSLQAISAAMQRGTLAGNVCTRSAPRRDVAGVDCSAFVSATWGLSQHFTTIAIPSISRPLANAWDLKPGDALNKPGSHVMLFLRFTPDRKAEVMEAATSSCMGRVCRNVYPLGSLLARGYRPVRYKGLDGEVARLDPAAVRR